MKWSPYPLHDPLWVRGTNIRESDPEGGGREAFILANPTLTEGSCKFSGDYSMILRFTKKAQTKLKLSQLPAMPDSANLFDEWYINVFHCNRYKYFLITNSATLFTVILHGGGIKDENDLQDRMFSVIRDQMNDIKCEPVFEKRISPNISGAALSSTNSRALVGSINDMIYNAKFYLDQHEMSPFEAGKAINETPFSYLKMENPNLCLKKYMT